MAVLNRVYDTVAVGFVHWKTTQPDSGGASYPGPGIFGVNTSDFVVSAETSDLTDEADEIAAAATAGAPNSLAVGTVKSQLDENLGHINDHENAGTAHAASAVSYAGSPNWHDGSSVAAGSVESGMDEIVTDLASLTGNGGADRIGSAGEAGAPLSLASGSARDQLGELLQHINDHLNDAAGAHAGTAISNAPAGNIAATTVQAAINELDSEKAGLALNNTFTGATNTFSQLLSLTRTGDSNAKLQFTDAPGAYTLLMEIAGTSSTFIRVYSRSGPSAVMITTNAGWNGSVWVKDNTSFFSTGWQFDRLGTWQFLRVEAITNNWTVWDDEVALDIILPGLRATSTNAIDCFGAIQAYVNAASNIGSGLQYNGFTFPAAPSSFTFTVHDSFNLSSGPLTWQVQPEGAGIFMGTAGAGNSRMYYTASVS